MIILQVMISHLSVYDATTDPERGLWQLLRVCGASASKIFGLPLRSLAVTGVSRPLWETSKSGDAPVSSGTLPSSLSSCNC